MNLHAVFAQEGLDSVLVVSLLSVGVLVALFFYLNRYTRRAYFTVWATAWLFYALWLSLKLVWPDSPLDSLSFLLKQLCIETCAVFLLWGSYRFLGLATPQTLMGLFLSFLYVWSLVTPKFFDNALLTEVPCFSLMGLSSITAGICFIKFREHRRYVGANLLTLGFILWGIYLAGYPFAQRHPNLAGAVLFSSATIQLLIAVSMIILVLEEVRYTNDAMIEQMQSIEAERKEMQARIHDSEQQVRTLFADASLKADMQRAYEELRQTHQAVVEQERLSVLGQVASGMAHDINNALTPLIGFSEVLLETEDQLPERLRKALKSIRDSGANIAGIVERVRHFYRGKSEHEVFARVDVNALVADAVETMRQRWREHPPHKTPAVLETAPGQNLPDIEGEAVELRDALTQLIANAGDAMPNGGTIRIATRLVEDAPLPITWEQRSHVVIEIADNGTGMDEQTRQRCFEPFFSTKKPRHSGLGLAMVYGAMQRHLGTVQVESELGKGTTMRVLLPLRQTPFEPSAQPSSKGQPSIRLRVLCIDDEQPVRMLLKDVLEMYGHTVETAEGGERGIERFEHALSERAPFDIVITDLGMPDVDGRQVVQAIKRECPHTPVVVLTGWATLLEPGDALLKHADAILKKPLSMAQLQSVLARFARAGERDEADSNRPPATPRFTAPSEVSPARHQG